MNEPSQFTERKQRRSIQLRLSTLFLIMAVFALAAGWWADRSRLERRLKARSHQIKIFSITNADANQMATVVRDMYRGDADNPLTVSVDSRSNSVIVQGPEDTLAKVEAVMLYLDRPK